MFGVFSRRPFDKANNEVYRETGAWDRMRVAVTRAVEAAAVVAGRRRTFTARAPAAAAAPRFGSLFTDARRFSPTKTGLRSSPPRKTVGAVNVKKGQFMAE